MTENERFAWLQLAFTPYIGAESFLVLLQQFGSAQAALNAPADKIAVLVRHKQAAESWRNADKRGFGAAVCRSRFTMGNAGRLPSVATAR